MQLVASLIAEQESWATYFLLTIQYINKKRKHTTQKPLHWIWACPADLDAIKP